jgi:DNA-binding MarR family transcriptional regulator
VSITAKGRRQLERARNLAFDAEGEVLRGLTAKEHRELVELLRKALSAAPPQPLWSAAEGD